MSVGRARDLSASRILEELEPVKLLQSTTNPALHAVALEPGNETEAAEISEHLVDETIIFWSRTM